MSTAVHDFSARQHEVYLLIGHNDLERGLNRLLDLVYEFSSGGEREQLVMRATRLSMQYKRIEDRLRKDELDIDDELRVTGKLVLEAMEMIVAVRTSADPGVGHA